MKKQTALQWLIGQYYDNEGAIGIKQLEQAEKIERDNIIKAYQQGMTDGYGDTLDFTNNPDGEIYFNEVYGGQDEN
jgi:hypothetical protein